MTFIGQSPSWILWQRHENSNILLCHQQVCFEVRVLEKLPVTMPETETNPHVSRVGWSVDRANLQVSEAV